MIEHPLLRLASAAIDRPRRALVGMAVLTLLAAPGLLRLEQRTDGHALVPAEDPAVLVDREVRRHFGLRDPIIVLLETGHPDGIFNPETLGRVRALTDALAALPEVGESNVTSLATERRHRMFPGKWEFRTFLDPHPDTPELLGQVRGDLLEMPIFEGILVSADRRATAILVGVEPPGSSDVAGSGERAELYRRILATLEPFAAAGDDRFRVVGAPVAEALLGDHILEDLALLLPLALSLIALVLWLGCRRLWGVALGLLEVGACLVWTFGVMGWLGFPVYLTTAVLPVILTSIGLADEIHVFWRYQRRLEADEDAPHPAAVRATMADMTRPVVLTSVTSAVGFLSFLASSIEPVRSFGVFAAAGILFCMVFSLTVIPAALTLLPAESLRHPRAGSRRSGDRLQHLTAPALAHRRLTWAVLLLVTVALGAGVMRLEVQDSWLDGFAAESPFRRATDRVNEALHGSHTLLVHLRFDPPPETVPDFGLRRGPLLVPAALAAVGELEAFLRQRPEVGGVIGAHSQLTTIAYLWGGKQESRRAIPAVAGQVNVLMGRFELSRGAARRREVLDDALERTVVMVFLKQANYRDTAALVAALRDYERRHLTPVHARVELAGDVAVSQAMIPAIVRGQVSSLLLALLGAAVTVCVLYRSWRGLRALVPAALAVLWLFGLMGWAGIPLGVATSMFCAITLGIGVDHGIHFLARHEHAAGAGHRDPARHAIATAGPAIVIDTLAIAAGFGLLAASQVPANARLGLLVAAALLASCVLTLGGLGAWLSTGPDPSPEKI